MQLACSTNSASFEAILRENENSEKFFNISSRKCSEWANDNDCYDNHHDHDHSNNYNHNRKVKVKCGYREESFRTAGRGQFEVWVYVTVLVANRGHFEPTLKSIDRWNYRKYSETSYIRTRY